MAKKIKFALEMGNGISVRNLDDLKDNFDLAKVIGYFSDGKLLTWLQDRFYEDEARSLENLDINDPELAKKICKILDVDPTPYEMNVNHQIIATNQERLNKLKQYTTNIDILKKINNVAFNQEELAGMLENNVSEIYLCDNRFSIPLSQKNKRYIGLGNAQIIIKNASTIDLDSLGIEFKNVIFDPSCAILLQDTAEILNQKGNEAKAAKKFEEAFKYYTQSANKGNAEAMNRLGEMYFNGIFVTEDKSKAFYWINKSAESGWPEAMNDVAYMYNNGIGTEKNTTKVMEWLEKAAEKGYVESMSSLADWYLSGQIVPVNAEKALYWYEKSFDNGVAQSSVDIGFMYQQGIGVKQSDTIAADWYRKGHEKGSGKASYNLGYMYMHGKGLPIDISKGHQYYQIAAERKYLYAINYMGTFEYDKGNFDKAIEWYGLASDSAEPLNMIGVIYENKGDRATALRFYEKSASLGCTIAMVNSGRINELIGKPQEALGWYNKAIDQEDDSSCFGLYSAGHLYHNGYGVNQSYDKAEAYYRMALEQGYTAVQPMLNKILNRNPWSSIVDPDPMIEEPLRMYLE